MSDRIKSVLTACGPNLLQDLSAGRDLLIHLLSKKIITGVEYEDISGKESRNKKVEELLNVLKRK